jgi:hypothetical protein
MFGTERKIRVEQLVGERTLVYLDVFVANVLGVFRGRFRLLTDRALAEPASTQGSGKGQSPS